VFVATEKGEYLKLREVSRPLSWTTSRSRPALRQVRVPVLALGGTLDQQVPARENLSGIDAALRASGNEDYKIVELAGLNHLFQTATTGAPAEYATIDETVAPQVLDLIASWINQRFSRR
jgi:uncharacterized protein